MDASKPSAPTEGSSGTGTNNSGSTSSSAISISSSSSSSSSNSSSRQQPQDAWAILAHAKSQAFKGGMAGASAQVFNVMTFMWLRTTMNYQYRHGGSTTQVIKTLWKEGVYYPPKVPARKPGAVSTQSLIPWKKHSEAKARLYT